VRRDSRGDVVVPRAALVGPAGRSRCGANSRWVALSGWGAMSRGRAPKREALRRGGGGPPWVRRWSVSAGAGSAFAIVATSSRAGRAAYSPGGRQETLAWRRLPAASSAAPQTGSAAGGQPSASNVIPCATPLRPRAPGRRTEVRRLPSSVLFRLSPTSCRSIRCGTRRSPATVSQLLPRCFTAVSDRHRRGRARGSRPSVSGGRPRR
jgi:hypothetical protein